MARHKTKISKICVKDLNTDKETLYRTQKHIAEKLKCNQSSVSKAMTRNKKLLFRYIITVLPNN